MFHFCFSFQQLQTPNVKRILAVRELKINIKIRMKKTIRDIIRLIKVQLFPFNIKYFLYREDVNLA